jgi:hypothetical protein
MPKTTTMLGTLALPCALVLCLLASGCSHVYRYSKPGATQEEFMKDRAECLQQARRGADGKDTGDPEPSCADWMGCMDSRGYVPDDKGALKPPPGAALSCRR